MSRIWAIFFMFWPIVAIVLCWVAPQYGWWFPGPSFSPLGERIDELFNLILVITTVVFILTQMALGYVLWTGAIHHDEEGGPRKAWFTHGSHNLEVMWTVVPAGILLFIALYQMDVWAEYRIKTHYPEEIRNRPIAEVTARQFEWRIRYPGLDENGELLPLEDDPQPTDLYTVNDLHVPSGVPVLVNLRSDDVQHSLFIPELRVKQDAVPGLVIPVWWEATKSREYAITCAELCGWGHYKMDARLVAQPELEFKEWMRQLQAEQQFDGVPVEATEPGVDEPE